VSAKLKFQLPDLKIIYEAKDQIHVELIQILILINILFFKVCFSSLVCVTGVLLGGAITCYAYIVQVYIRKKILLVAGSNPTK
jgi:hypothetical protein